MKHGERIRDCQEPEAAISLQGLVGEVPRCVRSWLEGPRGSEEVAGVASGHPRFGVRLAAGNQRRLVCRPLAMAVSCFANLRGLPRNHTLRSPTF